MVLRLLAAGHGGAAHRGLRPHRTPPAVPLRRLEEGAGCGGSAAGGRPPALRGIVPCCCIVGRPGQSHGGWPCSGVACSLLFVLGTRWAFGRR